MIKLKNEGEFLINFTQSGAASVAHLGSFIAPFTGVITAISIAFGQMGTDGTGSPTQNIEADIQINGTSIYSAVPQWTHANQVGTAGTTSPPDTIGTLSTALTTFTQGQAIVPLVSQILNGTSPTQPTDLCVQIAVAPIQGNVVPSATKQQVIVSTWE